MVIVDNDRPDDAQTLPSTGRRSGLATAVPLGPLPDDPTERAALLEAVVEHQAALLQREDEVHRILVRHRPGRRLGRGALRVGGRLLRRRGDGDDHRRPRPRHGRQRQRGRARPGARLLRPHRPPHHRDRARRHPRRRRPRDARRAMVRIAAGTSTTACSAAFCADRSLTADDVHLLERAATVAALAITKEQAVSAVESKYRAEFLRDALAGRAGDADRRRRPRQLRSAGTSTARWWSSWPRPTRTTPTPPASAEEVRSLQERFVAGLEPGRCRCATPRRPVMGFSQEVVALFAVTAERRHRRDHAHRRRDRPGRQRHRRRRSAHLLDGGLAPDRLRGRPAAGLRRGAQGGAASGASCTATRPSPTSTGWASSGCSP